MLFGELNIILQIDIPTYYDYIFIKSTHSILIEIYFDAINALYNEAVHLYIKNLSLILVIFHQYWNNGVEQLSDFIFIGQQ